jgi:hypothetical protein
LLDCNFILYTFVMTNHPLYIYITVSVTVAAEKLSC